MKTPQLRALSLFALPAILALSLGHAQQVTEIGGQKIVTLKRVPLSTSKPEFTGVTLAPGRGMELLDVTANFPGKGEVHVLTTPGLAGAKKMLDSDDDAFGDLGYRLGAAFLVPYPNRIRGTLSAVNKSRVSSMPAALAVTGPRRPTSWSPSPSRQAPSTQPSLLTTSALKLSPSPLAGIPTSTCPPVTEPRPACSSPAHDTPR